nr:hypothetical protein [Vibrio cholerae]
MAAHFTAFGVRRVFE